MRPGASGLWMGVSRLKICVRALPTTPADLQMVNMSLRILSKPDEPRIPQIFKVRHRASRTGWASQGREAER